MSRLPRFSFSGSVSLHKLLTVVGVAGLLLAAAPSYGHTVMVSPMPRDQSDSHKDSNGGAPCGGVARTATPTVYSVGQSVNVKWTETVDHPGCFLVDLSAANDQNFQLLANVKHVAGTTPAPYMTQVTLPAGMACDQCTMRVRQIMLADDVTPCPPNPIPVNATYYSCADVQITDGATPDMGTGAAPDLASGSVNPGGGNTATGCHSVPRSAGAASLLPFGLFALSLLALRRRRAKVSSAG